MTTVLFDAASGRLRLDRPAFDALVGERTGRADAALRAAGVLDEHGDPSPVVSAGVAAVADPVCRLALHVQHADGGREAHEGWVAGYAAALLLAGDDNLYELVSVHPSFLPEAVARLVGLGPRPRVLDAAPMRLTAATVDELTSGDPARRAAARGRLLDAASVEGERATAEALGAGTRRRWEAVITWDPAPGAAGKRAVHVIDTTAGLWLLDPAGEGLLAAPTTPTGIWRLLTILLPRDRELHPRHRGS